MALDRDRVEQDFHQSYFGKRRSSIKSRWLAILDDEDPVVEPAHHLYLPWSELKKRPD